GGIQEINTFFAEDAFRWRRSGLMAVQGSDSQGRDDRLPRLDVREVKQQPAACDMDVDHFFERPGVTGLFPDIKMVYHCFAIYGHVEGAPAGAVHATAPTQPGFHKVQFQTVITILYREGICEFLQAVAKVLEQGPVRSTGDGVGRIALAGEEGRQAGEI